MLQDVRDNIKRLIALYEKERERANVAAAEIERLNVELETCRKQNTELNRKIDNIRLSGVFSSSSSNESKERLDKLIREVDKCIRLLES